MRLAGFDVRSVAVAELALRLHQEGHFELAQHVGLAVDTNQRDLKLTPDAARIALDTIGDDEREELATLRDALTRQIAERAIGRKLSSARRSVRRWVQLERGYGSPLGH